MPPKPNLNALTGLRAVAAIHVLLFHYTIDLQLPEAFPRWLLNIIRMGPIAVNLFFILSGFILIYRYTDAQGAMTVSRRAFWVARFARIYPMYFVGFLVFLPAAFYHLRNSQSPSHFLFYPASHFVAVLFLTVTLMQAWLGPAYCNWNLPGWSLSDEAFFYFAFALIVPLLARWTTKRLALVGTLLWIVALLLPSSGIHFYVPIVRLHEFLLGVLLGKLFTGVFESHSDWKKRLTPAAPILSLATAGLLLFALANRGPASETYFLFGALDPLFCLMILSLALGGGALAKFLATSLLVLVGEASYSLYILHSPLHGWLKFANERAGTFDPSGWLFFAVKLTIALTLPIAAWRWIECPARKVLWGWYRRWSRGA